MRAILCGAVLCAPRARARRRRRPPRQRCGLGPDARAAARCRHERRARAHQDAVVGRVRGPRAREPTANAARSTTWSSEFTKAGLKPGNTDGTYIQKVPLVGITPTPAPLVFRKGARQQTLKWKDDVVAWTKHVADAASLDASELVFVGYGVVAPEYRLGRLQGRGRQRQDARHARQRSAGRGCRRTPARSIAKVVRRQGDDVLRPLDLQVRDRRGERRCRRAHRPRDRSGRLSVQDSAGQQHRREVRSGHARQEHGPRRHRRLDHARPGEEAHADGGAGFRRAEEAGRDARVQAGRRSA